MEGEYAMNVQMKRSMNRPLPAWAMVLACTISSASAAEIERVEPPNWWVGFQHPQLELLVYGEDAGTLSPSVDWPGVSVNEVIMTGNPNYLFVRLDIGPDTEAGEFDIVFEGAGDTITHAYSLNERNQDPEHTRGFSAADAIYLITPDRFANGDPDNDEIEGMGDVLDRSLPRGRHGGDVRGIIDRLDYIAGLGFTAVWLNPVLENAMPEFSYHGYSTTDFYRVDPRKGSNEDLAELARVGREKGVGLIMDMIVNHSGLYHWWMDDPPMDDWVHQWDGYVGTTHAKSLSVDPYGAEVDRREFYDGWFVPSMPDLNQDNPLMSVYLIQNAIWWIEYLGLAGVRMDTYPYSGAEFMAEWTRRVMEEFPDFNVVGEEWTENPLIVAYWQGGAEKARRLPLLAAQRDGLSAQLRARLVAGGRGTVYQWIPIPLFDAGKRCPLSGPQRTGHFRRQPRHEARLLAAWGRLRAVRTGHGVPCDHARCTADLLRNRDSGHQRRRSRHHPQRLPGWLGGR